MSPYLPKPAPRARALSAKTTKVGVAMSALTPERRAEMRRSSEAAKAGGFDFVLAGSTRPDDVLALLDAAEAAPTGALLDAVAALAADEPDQWHHGEDCAARDCEADCPEGADCEEPAHACDCYRRLVEAVVEALRALPASAPGERVEWREDSVYPGGWIAKWGGWTLAAQPHADGNGSWWWRIDQLPVGHCGAWLSADTLPAAQAAAVAAARRG